jgi:opacity protein-like surface antigen
MVIRRIVALLLAAIVTVWWGVAPADAEWNLDLYGGAAWIPNSDLTVRGQDNNGASINATIFDLDTDPGFTVGTRVSYWLNPLPFLGFDLDVFYMQLPVPHQTTTATGGFTGEFLGKPISVSASGVAPIPSATLPIFGFAPELRLRWPLLVDAAFPFGRLQPYFTGGPAWAFSLKNEQVAVEFGGKVGGGLTFLIKPWLGIYSEYRYIFFPGFELTTDRSLTYKANINSHTVVGGLSFRF